MIFKLAIKNLIRNKRRTVLTLLLITFSIGLYMWLYGAAGGIREKSFENLIEFTTSHIKIRNIEYDEKKPFSKGNFISSWDSISKILKEKDFIHGFTPRIKIVGEVDNGIDSINVLIWGISGKSDSSVFKLEKFVTEGELSEGALLIGKSLASDLDVVMDDHIYLTVRSMDGMIDSREFLIGGIVNAADPEVNNSSVYITLSDAAIFLGTSDPTEIAILTDSPKKTTRYIEAIAPDLPKEVEAIGWRKLGESFIAFANADWNSALVFVFLVMILAFVGIANTMMLSIFEKRKQIGTLKALGMADGQVRDLFVLEGTFIAISGALLGMILGSLAIWYFSIKGIDLTAMMGSDDVDIGYKVMGVIKTRWSFAPYLHSLLISVIAGAGASYFPANKTTKMEPAECLRD